MDSTSPNPNSPTPTPNTPPTSAPRPESSVPKLEGLTPTTAPGTLASNGNDADPSSIPVSGPKLPTAEQVSAATATATAALNSLKKNFFQQWQSWVMIACGVIAVIGVVCGILGFSAQVTAEAKVADLQKELDESNALLVKYGTELGIKVNEFGRPIHGTPVKDSADDDSKDSSKDDDKTTQDKPQSTTPATIASSDYIYIGEWGVKIKIPKGLKNVSYTFDNILQTDEDGNQYTTEAVRVSGILNDMTSTPEAFRIGHNDGLGVLERTTTDPSESPSGGTLVTKIDDYYYSYYHPQAPFSVDETEQQQEVKTAELIQKMLSTKSNITKF